MRGLPPWIAAEHRNTGHPHVHVVLPAFREVRPECFRQIIVTKPRLASMKAAMTREIERQRGVRSLINERSWAPQQHQARHDRFAVHHRSREWRPRTRHQASLTALLLRAGAHYLAQAEREQEALWRRAEQERQRDQEMER